MSLADAVKYLSIVASAVFGIFAVFGDTHSNGRVTRYGYIAILGLLIAAAVGAYSQHLDDEDKLSDETARNNADIKRETEWIQQMALEQRALTEMRRQLYPIDRWDVTIAATYPVNGNPYLEGLKTKLDAYIAMHPDELANDLCMEKGGRCPRSLTFYIGSPLLGPAKDLGLRALIMADYAYFDLDVSPQGKSGFGKNCLDNEAGGEEVMAMSSDFKSKNVVFAYYPDAGVIKVTVATINAQLSDAHELITLPDLVGRKIDVISLGIGVTGSIDEVTLALQKGTQVDTTRQHTYRVQPGEQNCGSPTGWFAIGQGDFPILGHGERPSTGGRLPASARAR